MLNERLIRVAEWAEKNNRRLPVTLLTLMVERGLISPAA